MTMTDIPKVTPKTAAKRRAKKTKDLSPKKMGRPTMLNEDMAVAIIALLSRGNYRKVVAEFVGIRGDTLSAWVDKGLGYLKMLEQGESLEADEQLFADFAAGVFKAESRAEIDAIESIMNAGKHDWRASAWYFERTKPDRFGKIDRSEVNANLNVSVDPGELSRKLQHLVEKAINKEALEDARIIEGVLVDDDVLALDDEDWDEPVG